MQKISFKDATRRYNQAFAVTIIIYIAMCFGGPELLATMGQPTIALAAIIAILNAVPLGIIFWLIGRYLNETDEFTRKIQIDAILLSGGITLSLTVMWGFLELYQAVPVIGLFPLSLAIVPGFFLTYGLVFLAQGLLRG